MKVPPKDRILLVDDEPNVLAGYQRGLRKRFNVVTAESGDKALQIIDDQEPFAVIVADMRMPGMDGVQFLKKAKRLVPDSVRMMLTGNADQDTAKEAVNRGSIFRFLTKPCSSTELIAALATGIHQYKLITAEKEILEQTLFGSIKMLTDLISLSEPGLMATAEKVRAYVQQVVPFLKLQQGWELEMASLLAPLGMLTMPPESRANERPFESRSEEERAAIMESPNISARLIASIPRLENVASYIEKAGGHLPVSGKPDILLESQSTPIKVLRILSHLVYKEQQDQSIEMTFKDMAAHPTLFDSELTLEIERIVSGRQHSLSTGMTNMETRVKSLLIGDLLAQDVESLDDRLLLAKGTVITEVYLARLHNYRRLVGIQEPLQIFRPNTSQVQPKRSEQ